MLALTNTKLVGKQHVCIRILGTNFKIYRFKKNFWLFLLLFKYSCLHFKIYRFWPSIIWALGDFLTFNHKTRMTQTRMTHTSPLLDQLRDPYWKRQSWSACGELCNFIPLISLCCFPLLSKGTFVFTEMLRCALGQESPIFSDCWHLNKPLSFSWAPVSWVGLCWCKELDLCLVIFSSHL